MDQRGRGGAQAIPAARPKGAAGCAVGPSAYRVEAEACGTDCQSVA